MPCLQRVRIFNMETVARATEGHMSWSGPTTSAYTTWWLKPDG